MFCSVILHTIVGLVCGKDYVDYPQKYPNKFIIQVYMELIGHIGEIMFNYAVITYQLRGRMLAKAPKIQKRTRISIVCSNCANSNYIAV